MIFVLIFSVLCEYNQLEAVQEMQNYLVNLLNSMKEKEENRNPNPVRAVFGKVMPNSVRPYKPFKMSVVVSYTDLVRSGRDFYFRIDEGAAVQGFVDSKGNIAANMPGQPIGNHNISISYDQQYWTPVGTLKVARRSFLFWVMLFCLIFGGLCIYSRVRTWVKRQMRKRRSGSGIRNTLPR